MPEPTEDIKANPKSLEEFFLQFSLIKICHKIAKMGKDVKFIYTALDEDGNGSLDPEEILTGLKDKFSIYFSEEEAVKLCKYLDEDGSGDVDLEEFKSKVSYDCYNNWYHLYTITQMRFVELLLQEWDAYMQRTHQKLMQKFVEFDDNGDGVLTFEEFEQLINNLEKSMDRNRISELFNETLEMDERDADLDKMNPD
jgi:Ca2+-binding EF-hand superfamily protein